MAAKTRAEIISRILQYLPQVAPASKLTLIQDSINLALEDLTSRPGIDFRFLRVKDPDTASLTAGEYYVDLTDFPVMGGTSSYFRDISKMFLLKSGSDTYDRVTFLDDAEFHDKYGYVDYASRSRGIPSHYTRLEDRFIFSCPLSEARTARVWWTKYHAPLTVDSGTGGVLLFPERDQMTAMYAVIYLALAELKNSLNTVEFPQELAGCEKRAETYIAKLIARDKDAQNEDVSDPIGWSERAPSSGGTRDPYAWVTP